MIIRQIPWQSLKLMLWTFVLFATKNVSLEALSSYSRFIFFPGIYKFSNQSILKFSSATLLY